jgi:hypothetical protein
VRLVSYQSATGPRVAAIRGGALVDLNRADPSLPATIIELLDLGSAGIERASASAAKGESFPIASVKLLAPVPRPEKVICVGLNYADHARETGKEPPSEPVIFSKFITAVAAHGDPIVLPKLSRRLTTKRNWSWLLGEEAGTFQLRRRSPMSPVIAADTTSRPATGRRASRAGNGSSGNHSMASHHLGLNWSLPTNLAIRAICEFNYELTAARCRILRRTNSFFRLLNWWRTSRASAHFTQATLSLPVRPPASASPANRQSSFNRAMSLKWKSSESASSAIRSSRNEATDS